MSIRDVLDLLRCPRCEAALTTDGRSVGCAAGHRYDLARQGYLNLSGGKEPRNADTTSMLAARDRFLSAGHYGPIADRVLQLVRDRRPAERSDPETCLLDVGSGTGYYLSHLLSSLSGSRGVALDVSVGAARRASRIEARLGAVVADAWQRLPVAEGSIDVVLDVFAPRNHAEFRRVLAGSGVLITVSPAPDHLGEVRERLHLLDIQPGKYERLAESLAAHFSEASSSAVRFRTSFEATALRNLVAMGPQAFHLAGEEIAELVQGVATPVDVTVAVDVAVWAPRP